MQDIAGASGLTKASLYYHFRDKYELFTTIALLELECINLGLEGIFASENALREQLVDAGTRSAPVSGNGCVASDRGGFLTYDMIDVSTVRYVLRHSHIKRCSPGKATQASPLPG